MLQFNPTKNWYKRLAAMTESNEHGYRLQEIALNCKEEADLQGDFLAREAFNAYYLEFREIIIEHEKARSLTYRLYIRRNALADAMMREIRETFGPEVERKIHATG